MNVRWLGRLAFADALALQEKLVADRRNDNSLGDEFLLLEHEPVYTIGRTPDQSSLRSATQLPHPLFPINRGGQATYHGPGQLIGYPIIDLRNCGQDLHRYLRWLEELLVETLGQFRIESAPRAGLTGVWVANRKIASIGVGVRHWITMHGFALNVCGDLSPFDQIIPCGIVDVTMTSIEKENGAQPSVREVASLVEKIALSRIGSLRKVEPFAAASASVSAMPIPLEDNVSDIIGKAQRGLGISDSELAERTGVNTEAVRKLRAGDLSGDAIEQVAPLLKLSARALRKLAAGDWQPEQIGEIDGLAMFNTTYGDMTVNAYLVWDPGTREAVAFDTGADCSAMLRRIESERLTPKLILLTHAHPDHVADLRRLRKAIDAPVYISEREPEEGAEPIGEGKRFKVGALQIEARLTSGHSPGGLTYVVTGLARPIAVVGDSLFAASMGGGNVSYEDALRNNHDKILTLPDETIVCPGHGPLTTVGKEKRENPFFAES